MIRLLTDADVDPSTVSAYAATRFGAAILTAENMAAMDETFLGTFAAVCPKRSFDVDGDGQNENVFYTVKTDLRAGQSKSGETVLFREKNIPMEMGMDSFEKLFVYYQSKPLIVRWCVMFVSFLLLTWGGSWFGWWIEELYIPVLSCSKYNPEQIVASSCYYMSHLNILFTLEPQKIIVFFACFFIPLFLFGKLFCGFICPMGFVQDVLHAARQKTGIQGVTLTQKLYERLSIIKWTAVMLFLGMGFAGLDFCNICPVVTLSPAFSGFKTTIYISGFVMLFVLVASFFKSRFFCNIYPLGLIMGLFHRFTLVRLQKDCTACTECGACYNACPMGIRAIYTEREKINVTDTNCLFCGECVRNCPEDNALTITLAGVKLYSSSREKFMKRFDRKEAAEK